MSQLISIREFARRKGVSDTAIHKHIKAGHLKECIRQLSNGRPALVADIAEREWTEFGAGTHSAHFTKSKRSNGHIVAQSGGSLPQSDGTMLAAKKAKEVYAAKLAQLNYERAAGMMVSKEKVYKAFYAVGAELKQAIEKIPDRIIDDILSATDRHEAHAILYAALNEALEKLSNFENYKFTDNENT